MGTAIYPGDRNERKNWSRRFQHYCDRIDYPRSDRQQDNETYVTMRELWVKGEIQRKRAELAQEKKMDEADEIIQELKQMATGSTASTPVPRGQGNLSAARTAVRTMMTQPIGHGSHRPATQHGTRIRKPPPTGYHSPLKVYKWLVVYLPQLFRGDKKMLKATVHKTIFQMLQHGNVHLGSSTPSGKKKHARLYFTQRRMLKWIMKNPWAAFEVFRSAGKTQLAIGLIAYLICENPNLRLFLMSSEYKKTASRVRLIRKLLCSKKIVEDYGYLIDDSEHGKSTEGMFQCYRDIDAIEPTLMAITWKDDKALGYHFDGGILDDPWSNKMQSEGGTKKRWLDWWGEFRFCLENAKFCWMLRTRKAVHDLYEALDAKAVWAVYRQPLVIKMPSDIKYLHNKEGVNDDVTFNNDYIVFDECFGKYTMKNLLLLRKEDYFYFEREIQNRPFIIEGNILKWKFITLFDSQSDNVLVKGLYDQIRSGGHGVSLIKVMDMAFGASPKSDYNVLLVLAKYKNRYFLLDGWIGRWDFGGRLKAIQEAEDHYPGVPLYIEADYAQNATVNDIKNKVPHLKINKFMSRGKGRDASIYYEGDQKAKKKGKIHDALVTPWNDGLLYFHKNLEHLDMLKEQTAQFPNCDFFDYVDALAMGILILRPIGGSVAVFA